MTRKSIGCAVKAALILLVAVAAFRLSPFYQVYQHLFVTEYTSFCMPASNVEIEHSRIGTHMLAEFDRWLTVIVDGKRFETRDLSVDTCGGYPINCYSLKGNSTSFLRLDDAVSEHLVDLESGEVHTVHRIDGVKYYGVVSNGDETSVWKVNGFDGSITIRGLPAKLVSDVTNDSTGEYIGQLDGKLGKLEFFTSDKRIEAKIRHRFE